MNGDEIAMKLPIKPDSKNLCGKCTGLCCRYFALAIDKPETRREFEDIRWYLLHRDTTIFVEDGEWYLQINAKCRALMDDNRCAIYEKRPTICRAYKEANCDWHGDEYDYDHIFVEPEQLAQYAEDYLAKKRKRRAAAKKRQESAATKKRRLRVRKTGSARRPGVPLPLLRSA
jgi:Fe-S-cluster containining protein